MRILTLFFVLFSVSCSPSAVVIAAPDSLRVGDVAPDFTLPLATRDSIEMKGVRRLDALRGGPVILAFYPADWSSGCTAEMCTVRDNFLGLSDNGSGFDPVGRIGQIGHYGLLGLRERARLLGGALDVQSSPQHGTCLTLRLPIENEVNHDG